MGQLLEASVWKLLRSKNKKESSEAAESSMKEAVQDLDNIADETDTDAGIRSSLKAAG